MAEVSVGYAPRLGIVGMNNRDEVSEGIALMRKYGNTLKTLRGVEAKVNQLNSSGIMPRGYKIVPYYDRGQIEDGALDGWHLEICYLHSPVDVLFAQIQGSARIRLEDGTILFTGGADKNDNVLSSAEIYNPTTDSFSATKGSLSGGFSNSLSAAEKG